MLSTIIILILAAAGGYFAYRWFTLRNALRQTRAELALVRQDLSQNQMLHGCRWRRRPLRRLWQTP